MSTKRTGRHAMQNAAKRLLRAVDRSVAAADAIRRARADLERAMTRVADGAQQPPADSANTGGGR